MLKSGIEPGGVDVGNVQPPTEGFTPRVEELLRAQPLNSLKRALIFVQTAKGSEPLPAA
jgi:hypothetical protein